MPTLGTAATAEGAWALAEALGIREHALVDEPVVDERDWDTAHRDEMLAEMGAEYVGQIALALVEPAPLALREAA